MKYIKKPVEIEAIQYNGDNLQECINFLDYANYYTAWNGDGERTLFIKTLEGDMKVSLGDYIIKGVKGEYYPCKPDIFEESYNNADEEKCVKDIRPADIPYDEYMKIVRENAELKETIIKLVKKIKWVFIFWLGSLNMKKGKKLIRTNMNIHNNMFRITVKYGKQIFKCFFDREVFNCYKMVRK